VIACYFKKARSLLKAVAVPISSAWLKVREYSASCHKLSIIGLAGDRFVANCTADCASFLGFGLKRDGRGSKKLVVKGPIFPY
jgi:hypothetical protein